eukprot:15337717-Ditylum_brightwellii.AAC.2
MDRCSFHYRHALQPFEVLLYSHEDNPECIGTALSAFVRCNLPICAMSNYVLIRHVGAYVRHHTFRDRDNLEDQA